MRADRWAWLMLLAVLAGCTLAPPGRSPATTVRPTLVAGGPPTVTIAWPADNTFASLGRPLDIDVRGVDEWPVGITTLELRVEGEVVDIASVPGGASRTRFSATLEWVPELEGQFELAAYALRADGTDSAPAAITVNVVRGPDTPAPTELVLPSATPSGSLDPSASVFPTDSGPPTEQPTPTATRTLVDIAVFARSEEIPSGLQVGQPAEITFYVRNNNNRGLVSGVSVLVRLAGGQKTVRIDSVRAGDTATFKVTVTPKNSGERLLRLSASLPSRYEDVDTENNFWSTSVTVDPAPTPPPTPTPEPTPPPEPSAGVLPSIAP